MSAPEPQAAPPRPGFPLLPPPLLQQYFLRELSPSFSTLAALAPSSALTAEACAVPTGELSQDNRPRSRELEGRKPRPSATEGPWTPEAS